MMEEAGVAVTLHIGSGVNMPPEYMNTGEERELKGNPFNIESTKAHDIPVLHHAIERWLTCMIYHGVLERFPRLKVGIIELGANWLPTTLANLDIGRFHLGKFDTSLDRQTFSETIGVYSQTGSRRALAYGRRRLDFTQCWQRHSNVQHRLSSPRGWQRPLR